jgi:membrane protein
MRAVQKSADPAAIQSQLKHLSGVLPDGAISVIGDQAQRIAAQGNGTLGFAFILGIAAALWSANAGVKALFDALSVAYEAEETRAFSD